jgi:DNA-binding NarL/FixJ family response regulator
VRHRPKDSEGDRVPEPLRVIVADNDPLARRVVRDTLESAGIVVIAEAATGREAVELSLYYKPHVVLMELDLPEGDGIHATRRVRAGDPVIEVVVLTVTEDDDVGVAALRAGACGFLSKTVGLEALPRALRGAVAGEAVVSRRLTKRIVDSMRRVSPDGAGTRPVRSPLTPREWEVLDLLCAGESTYGIADALVLSTDTVRSHIANLQRKLGVRSREAAIEEARRMRAGLHLAEDDAPLAAAS